MRNFNNKTNNFIMDFFRLLKKWSKKRDSRMISGLIKVDYELEKNNRVELKMDILENMLPMHTKVLTRLFYTKCTPAGVPAFLIPSIITKGISPTEMDGMILKCEITIKENKKPLQLWVNYQDFDKITIEAKSRNTKIQHFPDNSITGFQENFIKDHNFSLN